MINEWQSGSKILANLHVHGPKCMAVLTTSVTGAPKGWNGRRRGVFFLVITSIWDILKLLFLLCHRCFEIVCKKYVMWFHIKSGDEWLRNGQKNCSRVFQMLCWMILVLCFPKMIDGATKYPFLAIRLYNAMWVTHFFTAYDLMTALMRIKTFRFQRRLSSK